MSERRRRKNPRFLKETSDRSGFDNWNYDGETFHKKWQSIKQGGLTLEPEEFDMPPPSKISLGGADISGTPRANEYVINVDSSVASQVQYINSASTINMNSKWNPVMIGGSNIATSFYGNIVQGSSDQIMNILCVNSGVILYNSSSLILNQSPISNAAYTMNSGSMIQILYESGYIPTIGAIQFDGATGYLTTPDSDDFYFGNQQLTNGDFETWSGGASAAPDGWTLAGAGASVAREGTTIKIGTYSAKLTRSGADCQLGQDITNAGGHNLAYWKGRTITLGMWVYATSASKGYLIINDGVANYNSSDHPGDSAWHYLTVTATLSNSSTAIVVMGGVKVGDTSVYFDGAFVTDDAAANFDFTGGIWNWQQMLW